MSEFSGFHLSLLDAFTVIWQIKARNWKGIRNKSQELERNHKCKKKVWFNTELSSMKSHYSLRTRNSSLRSLPQHFDLIWFDLIWFDLIWFDLIWFDLIWFDLYVSLYLPIFLKEMYFFSTLGPNYISLRSNVSNRNYY